MRAWKPTLTADVVADGALDDIINRVSDAIIRITGREFVVDGVNPLTRVFDITRDVVWDRELELGDFAGNPQSVEIRQPDGTLNETVNPAALVWLPRRRESWQPYSHVRFVAGLPTSAHLVRGYTVEVRGNWGFPAVPDDVVHEAVKAVVARVEADAQSRGRMMRDAASAVGAPRSAGQHELPLSTQQLCERYRVPFAPAADS